MSGWVGRCVVGSVGWLVGVLIMHAVGGWVGGCVGKFGGLVARCAYHTWSSSLDHTR